MTELPHFTQYDTRLASYAVITREQDGVTEVLLAFWNEGRWTLPGGGVELAETVEEGCVREVFEETGLEARVGKLIGVDSRVMVREEVPEGIAPELHTIRIVYRASVKDGPLQHEIGGSSDEARWVPLREVRGLRTLSLVQTGIRMAGIDAHGRGRGGAQRRSTITQRPPVFCRRNTEAMFCVRP